MTITAGMVAQLRAKTDAPMMECKKALSEAQGDMDKAEAILRVKLGNKASKASERITAEGIIGFYNQNNQAALVELNCETDFVAKNDDFIAFASKAAQLAAENQPADVAALSQIIFDGQSLDAHRLALIGKIGENVSIRRFVRKTEHQQAIYMHGHKIGVLVEYTGQEAAARDAAMQIAAMKPLALDASGVDEKLIARERDIAGQKALESGKPPEVTAKMVEGSVQKYLKEVTLLSQAFVKNDKQTVAEMLKAQQTTLHGFSMLMVGEGIEKKQNDFAAEVAAQIAAVQS